MVSAAGSDPLVLSDTTGVYALGPQLAVFEDPAGTLTFAQILKQTADFEITTSEVPSFGYVEGAYWARVQVTSTAPDLTWVLEVANKSLDEVTLYRPSDSGWSARTAGDAVPFDERVVRHRNIVFPITPPADEVATYYLRVASAGPISLPVTIWEAEAFLQKDQKEQFFLGLFFGILAIMVVYNLAMYGTFRDRSYLFYVGYLACYIAYQFSFERLGFEFLWPEALWWNARANTVLGLLAAMCALQFTRSFLNTRRLVPVLDRVLMGYIAACVPLLIIALTGLRGVNTLVVFFILLIVSTALLTGFRTLLRGNLAARYYLLAWSFLLLGVFIGMLRYLGVVPYTLLTVRSVQVGAVLEVTLLSLGLNYRYTLLRKERERMRLRIAEDLHDDIGSGLTQVSLYSELVRRATDGQPATWAGQMGTLARDLTGRMQDIVWAIKPDDDSWQGLELRLKDYARTLFATSSTDLDLGGTTCISPPSLDPVVRQQVLYMTKELLHNVVKHADARIATVHWTLQPDQLTLRVSDDGRGFDPEHAVHAGNGLGSLRRRADDIDGTLTLDTYPGAGTTWILVVPLGGTPT